MTKKKDLLKSAIDSTDIDCIISSDEDDILEIPALKATTSSNQSSVTKFSHGETFVPHTIQTPVTQDFAMYPTQVMLPSFSYEDNFTSDSLIGTTEERLLLRNEMDLALMGSLEFDRAKHITEPSVETSIDRSHQDSLTPEFLQEKRKARVPPEPTLQEARTLVFARHTTLGTVSRFFKDSNKLMAVYDWVGSLSPHPPYFSLCLLPGVPLQPIESVTTIDRMVQMQELTEPLFLDLEDQEVSFAGYGLQEEVATVHPDEETVFQKINKRREAALSLLKEDPRNTTHVVTRANVIKDLVKLYNDVPGLKETVPVLRFADENAAGDGVSRDIFTTFFHAFCNEKCEGVSQCAPSCFGNAEIYENFGQIITHAFIAFNIFPIQFSKASLYYLLFNKVDDDVLLDSFKEFLPVNEGITLTKAMNANETEFESVKDEVIDILSDYQITKMPATANIREVVKDAASYALVQSPQFALLQIRKGMGFFWDEFTKDDICALYARLTPTSESLLRQLEIPVSSPQEEKVARFLRRYVQGLSKDQVQSFLQFTTGSSVILPTDAIAVQFTNDFSNISRRPMSKTCFKVLQLSKHYENFRQFVQNMDFYLSNSQWWDMQD